MKNIIIVAHKDLTHPDDELIHYLNEKKYDNILHINHSFFYAKDRKSWFIWYKRGKVFKKHYSLDYKFLPAPLLYVKETVLTFLWVYQANKTWNSYIGMDGLCVFWGNMLRQFGKVKKTYYWAIDFVPNDRFNSGIANKIYHAVNTHGYKSADEMWDLSPRMAEAREKFLGFTENMYRHRRLVPYGVWLKRIKYRSYAECDKNTLIYMGHISKKQGVQLIINALPEIVKKNPKFIFKIIGKGEYSEEIQKQVKKLKLEKHCLFLGKIESHEEVEHEIAKSALAVAPYIKRFDTWTYYADPGKVKNYLACGVPVLLTNVPWNTSEIVSRKCGVVITEDKKDIAEKITYLMNPKRNQEYRDNARKYAQSFNYARIFSTLPL